MNELPTQAPVTLESITARKAELLQQIRLQKETMDQITHEIFAPLAPATNKADAIMRSVNTGMAVFDGVMFGIKIMKRVRKLIGKR